MKQPIFDADELAGDLVVGDIIQASGNAVPEGLRGKYFAVMGFDEGGAAILSVPYHDAACVRPYTAPKPRVTLN